MSSEEHDLLAPYRLRHPGLSENSLRSLLQRDREIELETMKRERYKQMSERELLIEILEAIQRIGG